MAENQPTVESYLIGLGRGRSGFFCPESRFHLMGGVKPQEFWPVAAPLTSAVKVGLRAGSLRDVYGNIPFEAYASKKELAKLAKSALSEDEDFIMDDEDQTGGKQPAKDPVDPNAGSGSDDDEGGKAPTPDGDKLTEAQIDEASLKDLKAFIKDHELSMEDLGLNSRSNLDEVRHALKVHFGYKMV